MIYAMAAVCVGAFAYVALLAFQSPQSRRDLGAWGDLLFISGMLTTFLVIVMFWGMLGILADTTLANVLERMLWRRSSGRLNIWVLFGFAAVPFTVLAAAHVLVLRYLERSRRRHVA